MVQLTPTARFKSAYKKLTDDVRERVDDAIRQFYANPRHPGLHFEKLIGSEYRTIRVDRGRWRVVLREIESQHYELVDVDRHKAIDRNYG